MRDTALPMLSAPPAPLPARALATDAVPWVPLGEGKAFRPLRFLAGDRGFVELLRLDPGVAIPLHRHTGEVHAYNLEGSRRLHSGELIGPGGYVYEPAGNVDSWWVEGNTPLVVLVMVTGAVEYLDADGAATRRFTGATLDALYREHCATLGIAPLDLAG